MTQQTTQHLLMIRPVHFGQSSETIGDNSFQQNIDQPTRITRRALAEFEGLVQVLRQAGVHVWIPEDRPTPITPDAVFCNNWFSTHADGQYLTYPMYWPQRRAERRTDVPALLQDHFILQSPQSLEHWEAKGHFLESTGSLVLDRIHKIAYACLSNRCGETAVQDWCALMGYQPVLFTALDQRKQTIYHTNVMMACGTIVVPICLEAISDAKARQQVVAVLQKTNKTILALRLDQLDHFAGNMLEVQTASGQAWVLSSQAYAALTPAQRTQLTAQGTQILQTPLETIERYGGGSARCMMGEIFLPFR